MEGLASRITVAEDAISELDNEVQGGSTSATQEMAAT